MTKCIKCNGLNGSSIWNFENCPHCGYPKDDSNAAIEALERISQGICDLYKKGVKCPEYDDYQLVLDSMQNQTPATHENIDGAVHNGRIFMDRMENHYQFTDEHDHKLENCHTWHEVKRCFNFIIDSMQNQKPVNALDELNLAIELIAEGSKAFKLEGDDEPENLEYDHFDGSCKFVKPVKIEGGEW